MSLLFYKEKDWSVILSLWYFELYCELHFNDLDLGSTESRLVSSKHKITQIIQYNLKYIKYKIK